MTRRHLAKQIVDAATANERKDLLKTFERLADERLADEIRKICYASWTIDPARTRRAATALKALSRINANPYNLASKAWVTGIAFISSGSFERAIDSLEEAGEILAGLGRETDAAQTAVAMLLALAMLGRYDEAITVAQQALAIFNQAGDHLAAGKIEMNLSNIASRRSHHHEAEKYGASARRRFIKAGETRLQAMAENGLANTYTDLNDFKRAEKFYQLALKTARLLRMAVTEAEIEASLGNLALMRGDYSAALRSLETSRQRYAELGMPHQSAVADLEIADIYSELNLSVEAIETYTRLSSQFAHFKLRAEEARTRLSLGRVLIRTGDLAKAKRSLSRARILFYREENVSGMVASLLSLVEVELGGGTTRNARFLLNATLELIRSDENPRSLPRFELLSGIAAFSDDLEASEVNLHLAIKLAAKQHYPEAIRVAETWLGRVYLKNGTPSMASRHFRNAIDALERQRETLFNDEFSISFSASRLEVYSDYASLLISQGRVEQAFEVVEKGRSRSMLLRRTFNQRDPAARRLSSQAADVRAELNLLYRRSEVAAPSDGVRIKTEIRRAEQTLADLDRRIASLAAETKPVTSQNSADVEALPRSTTLVEYAVVDGRIGAFVANETGISFVPSVASESEITGLLERLHFQFDAARYGAARLGRFAVQMKAKADRCLNELYQKLFQPLADRIRGDRLLIIPAGPIHYVPFAALFDGTRYLAELFEIRSAPSWSVWRELSTRKQRRTDKKLLVGFADERIPLVESEIESIRKDEPNSTVLTGSSATLSAFATNAVDSDYIHIACHGEFRLDNPMYSSLHLADGWVTVRDLVASRINARLVTLSACEAGVSKIFPGEELLGLVRGFLSAGVQSLIVSLWAVNDIVSSEMMPKFYREIRSGSTPAAALRNVQMEMIGRGEHPFLWAPFIYIGP